MMIMSIVNDTVLIKETHVHSIIKIYLRKAIKSGLACAGLQRGELDQCHFVKHLLRLNELQSFPI